MLDFATIAQAQGATEEMILCTVVQTSGSTPQKVGAKMLVFADGTPYGRIQGTIGGGAIEHAVRKKALTILPNQMPLLFEVALTQELGMCCGGKMTVFLEPLAKKPKLYCFGAGHVSQALCPLAIHAGFVTTVIDPRLELLHNAAFDQACRTSNYGIHDIDEMLFDSSTFIVIATHDHAIDQEVVEHILPKPFQYAALVGSLRKAHMTRLRLKNKGFPNGLSEKLHCPAGLPIGGTTPFEIAISILAQMIEVRYAQRATDGSRDCRSGEQPQDGQTQRQSPDAL